MCSSDLLNNIGTNTHAQIDTFISSKSQASGICSLDSSTNMGWSILGPPPPKKIKLCQLQQPQLLTTFDNSAKRLYRIFTARQDTPLIVSHMLRDHFMRDSALGHEVVLDVAPQPVDLLGARLVQLSVDFNDLRELILPVADPAVADLLLLPLRLLSDASRTRYLISHRVRKRCLPPLGQGI